MLADLLAATLRSVRAHAFRFGLTSLGIVWGVAMLTYLTASMDGYDQHFARQLDQIGQRIVFLFPGTVSKARVGQRGARPVELERKDVTRLARLHAVERAAPNTWLGTRVVRAGRRTKLLWTYGASEDTTRIRNFELADGRFLSRDDVDGHARVVFLGAKAARRLFGAEPPVGRTAHIEGVPFRVIGVSRPKGDQLIYLGPADDEIALVPGTTARVWFTRTDTVGQVIFAPRTRAGSWEALATVRALLGLHHHFAASDTSAMSAFNIQEAVQLVDGLLMGLRVFLAATSGLTLFVGAVGVMNIMLVVVAERTREVGLKKAVGASNRAVFVEVMAETLAVTLAAGLVGASLGWLGVATTRAAIGTASMMQPVPVLEWGTVAFVMTALVAAGLVAGVLPALRAMRVDPAVALRSV